MGEEAMTLSQDALRTLSTETDYSGLGLDWVAAGTERGIAARPGRKGLTLDEINLGTYGEVPDLSRNYTTRPRGAAARPDKPRSGVTWDQKAEVWSSSIGMLYEEAVARQWSSATDIPWDQLTELPDELERAMCQLCTFLTQVEFIAGDLPGRWIKHISPDHYEVGLFLG